MFRWEPEGRFRYRRFTAIEPFWFSTDNICWSKIGTVNIMIQHISARLPSKKILHQHMYVKVSLQSTHVCMCVHVSVYLCLLCMYVCMYVWMCVCMYVCMNVCIASLGHVHRRFTSGVRMLEIPNVVAKSLAKYASVSAMIGSHIIWKKRGQILTK